MNVQPMEDVQLTGVENTTASVVPLVLTVIEETVGAAPLLRKRKPDGGTDSPNGLPPKRVNGLAMSEPELGVELHLATAAGTVAET
jgi:hypothetical protein